MVSQLKAGQTREQVRFILGSPLVTDVFHANRWDYVYRFQSGRGGAVDRKLTIHFVDNRLDRIVGDVTSGADTGARSSTRVIEIDKPAMVEKTITGAE
jgi:outer membrane protein assembly factor BamE